MRNVGAMSTWGMRYKKDFKNQILWVNYWCSVFCDKIITDNDAFDIKEHIDLIIVDQRTAQRKPKENSAVQYFQIRTCPRLH